MNIFAYVHGYIPIHNAGAEHALHGLLSWLVARGHRVLVYSPTHAESGWYDGVEVQTDLAAADPVRIMKTFDVAITHLDYTQQCVRSARQAGIPVVHYVHNDAQLKFHGVDRNAGDMMIYNAEWVRQAAPSLGIPCTLWPPIDPSKYQAGPGPRDRITLMNLNENKGAPLFWQLAERLPEYKFLAVKGSYGRQEIPGKIPDNVEVMQNTGDPRQVYAKTRILLVPSAYESWGRVAMEAACNGIPVIANPTPGLTECLGESGIYCDRNKIDDWVDETTALDREAQYYTAASMAVTARFAWYREENRQQLETVERLLLEMPAHRVVTVRTEVNMFTAERNILLNGTFYRRGDTVSGDSERIRELVKSGALVPTSAPLPEAITVDPDVEKHLREIEERAQQQQENKAKSRREKKAKSPLLDADLSGAVLVDGINPNLIPKDDA